MPLTIGAIAAIVICVGAAVSQGMITNNPFESKGIMNIGMDLPAIWIYYDTSVVNSRSFADFGSGSSRAISLPFLNLCYESIVRHNSSQYRIEPISGLADLADKLGGWDSLPNKLKNPLVTLEPSDFAWIRAAILNKYGGLWVAPATICLKPFGALPAMPVFFGTDSDESFVGTAGTIVPNFQVAWSPQPNHPLWAAWEAKSRNRMNSSGGGDTARSDQKWEYLEMHAMFPEFQVRPLAEVGRKGLSGKRIQIEDLLASGQEGDLPFEIGENAVYVPLPWPELRDRRAFGWFLKLSESQIADSDLVISDLFHRAGVI